MAPPNAAWIHFLRKYGPIKSNENCFDELIERARRRAGVEAITVPAPRIDEAVQILTDPKTPSSVILTGDAGDGKTYHCRQIWHRLGGTEAAWESDEGDILGVKQLSVAGRQLWVVRDLSELDDLKLTFFAELFKQLANPSRNRLFLIAANVGQLHDRWKAAAAALSDRFPIGETSWNDVEAQLFGRLATSDNAIKLFHLGRGVAEDTFSTVVDAVIEHQAWGQCGSCELREVNGKRCPILENRHRLRADSSGPLFRERLADLVLLNAQNQRHFTIRQILMLVSNVLLGHPNAPKDRLLRCDDVAGIHANNLHGAGSVYANVLGENLVGRQREAFARLARLGLGVETSNRLDRLLSQGPEDPALRESYAALVATDPVYGDTPQWRQARLNYLETGDAAASAEFIKSLRSQRQRLFFTIPRTGAADLGLWELTVYHHAGDFLEVVRRIRRAESVPPSIVRSLVRGLNRVFTGRLVSDDDRLVLATSGHDSQARTSLLFEGQVDIRGDNGESVRIVPGTRTAIALEVAWGTESRDTPIKLDLSALRFEFLVRVGLGALPSSFSLECHEDILAFKARLLRAYDRRRQRLGGDRAIKFLEISDDGRARSRAMDLSPI